MEVELQGFEYKVMTFMINYLYITTEASDQFYTVKSKQTLNSTNTHNESKGWYLVGPRPGLGSQMVG